MGNNAWLNVAKKYIGIEENKNSTDIKNWVKKMGPDWFYKAFNPTLNSGAWCGVFVANSLNEVGIKPPTNYMRASEWNNWGVQLKDPVVGAIVVFTREGGGHVGFVVGKTSDGHLAVLGGNQSNKVTVAKFDKSRVTSYRWPNGVPISTETLAVVETGTNFSTNEA